jgi:hypothetical protein
MQWVVRMRRFLQGPAQDQRRSPRNPGGALVAYYWTGGAPSPRKIANVSLDGAYVEAPDRWHPGTVITLTLQLGPHVSEGDQTSLGRLAPWEVRALVIRSTPEGFAVEFLFEDRAERAGFERFLQSLPLYGKAHRTAQAGA